METVEGTAVFPATTAAGDFLGANYWKCNGVLDGAWAFRGMNSPAQI